MPRWIAPRAPLGIELAIIIAVRRILLPASFKTLLCCLVQSHVNNLQFREIPSPIIRQFLFVTGFLPDFTSFRITVVFQQPPAPDADIFWRFEDGNYVRVGPMGALGTMPFRNPLAIEAFYDLCDREPFFRIPLEDGTDPFCFLLIDNVFLRRIFAAASACAFSITTDLYPSR